MGRSTDGTTTCPDTLLPLETVMVWSMVVGCVVLHPSCPEGGSQLSLAPVSSIPAGTTCPDKLYTWRL